MCRCWLASPFYGPILMNETSLNSSKEGEALLRSQILYILGLFSCEWQSHCTELVNCPCLQCGRLISVWAPDL